ncbi:hypothetical protein SteCoe_666 [Stentor coeruleus]|uniref:LITAF domain-containing protein n=1 Tax=Stentor coeruleus TaxID=5963 RepID=A0A1R2D3D3_9CILI|nr:hypothetical protein SteCoe_666 [Stentor coeruleus]
MEENSLNKSHRVSESQSFAFTSPKSSFIEHPSDSKPPIHKRSRHIRFLSNLPNVMSKDTTVAYSQTLSEPITPPTRRSLVSPDDHLDSNRSLWKLKDKFSKITEEIETARNNDKEIGSKTTREYWRENLRDTRISSPCEKIVQASEVHDDYEFGGIPSLMWCAYCGKESATEILYKNTSKTLISSIGIFLTGGFLGCFLLPYMSSSCKQTVLICHTCKREIGNY